MGVDNASLMAHPEPAFQSFQDLHNRPGIAWAFQLRQQLQGMQLEPHCIVLGHLPAVIEAQNLLKGQFRAQRPVRGLRALRGRRRRRLYRGRNCSSTPLASPMLLAPVKRSSVTSQSWKVPAVRSTRPLASGEGANIIRIPSSSMARLNWVAVPGRPDPRVYLKTPCRSM